MCHAQNLALLIRLVQEAKRCQQRAFGEIGFLFRIVLLFILMNACGVASAFATCDAPANPIEAENCLPGNPPGKWYVAGAGSSNIQGFTTDISVNVGQTVFFKINTSAAAYSINIYRVGYYQGNGARFVASVSPSVALPQSQRSEERRVGKDCRYRC